MPGHSSERIDQDFSRVDHLIYGTPDLDATIDSLEVMLGVRATNGGRHPGMGTRNALFSLGPTTYLEILGPDPDQPELDGPRWLGIDGLSEPRLTAWAANGRRLDEIAREAAKVGINFGKVRAGSRKTSDGSTLTWQLTDPDQIIGGGVVPFLIDWGETPHPAKSAIAGLRLMALRAEHPDPALIRGMFKYLGLDIGVELAPRPALVVQLDSPNGVVELR